MGNKLYLFDKLEGLSNQKSTCHRYICHLPTDSSHYHLGSGKFPDSLEIQRILGGKVLLRKVFKTPIYLD